MNTLDTPEMLKGALKGKTVDVAAPQKVKIYHYDPQTGELLRSEYALLDPVGGNPMIPSNATDLEPPAKRDGYALCYRKGWRHVKDYRGTIVWNKADNSKHKVNSIMFDITNQIEFTDIEPKQGQIWNFLEGKWDYPYKGFGRLLEPFIRFWKTIKLISDQADIQHRHRCLKEQHDILLEIKKQKAAEKKT